MEQEKRVIPVEIIDFLVDFNDQEGHLATSDNLNDDNYSISKNASVSLHNQRVYLKSIGLSDNECQMLMDKVMAYNELNEGESANNVSLGFTAFIISVVATILLLMFNINLIEKGRFWLLSIVLNIVAFIFVVISLKDMAEKGFKKLHPKDNNFNNDSINYAKFLMREHNYSERAIKFYYADSVYSLEELKAFVEKLW